MLHTALELDTGITILILKVYKINFEYRFFRFFNIVSQVGIL